MTTLVPRKPYTDAELETLYPPQLQLQLVQILLRHGERTPVTARFANAGLPAFWPYCNAVRHLRSAVLSPEGNPEGDVFGAMAWKRRLETFGEHDAPVLAVGPKGEVDAICDFGMLTDKGRETTTALGHRLRGLYVDQLGFLPPSIDSTEGLYLRATPIPRALESLQQAFQGLYPAAHRAADLPAPTILMRSPADETLFPNDSNCRRFAALSRAFAQRTAERWNDSGDVAYLTKKLGKWMPDGVVGVDARPRLSGLMDTINATAAHGEKTKLPKEFYDPKVKSIIEKIGVEEWYAGYRESQEYRTLGIGGLLGDVVARMVGSVEHTAADGQYEIQQSRPAAPGGGATPSHVKFGMSGCHDTTLAGVLSSLGAFGHDAWPPFTSHIAIELFRSGSSGSAADSKPSPPASSRVSSLLGSAKAGTPPPGIGRKPSTSLSEAERRKIEGYYVRLRYNDEPVTIPGCKAPGKHWEGDESFCTLAAFKDIVDKFTPHDWKAQCRSNGNAPAFPEKIEPAGY
ncbi:hypothetical protein N3K66_008134 [Trichothecium roseum]|uniref:Uncharacterized protein n=1 Tax=Trichothecium roseum TaxID=47278 RepID=A0ACC0UT39_9HYPO|nr:hypothetical protein N3K66_008134 [Trichothecium roseum]